MRLVSGEHLQEACDLRSRTRDGLDLNADLRNLLQQPPNRQERPQGYGLARPTLVKHREEPSTTLSLSPSTVFAAVGLKDSP